MPYTRLFLQSHFETLPELIRSAEIDSVGIAKITEDSIASLELNKYGLKSSPHSTTETVFSAASLSKPVFAYLVLRLIALNITDTKIHELGQFVLPDELKEFTLDSPLYKVLPELCHGKYSKEAKSLTARLVLSHQTGIPISQGNSHPEFNFVPGTEYGYGGFPYLYLQIVLERLTNASLQQLADEYIFKPLGMTQSSFIRPEYSSEKLKPISDVFPIEPDTFSAISANSLQTTPSDYASFISAWMNDENLIFAFNNHASLLRDRWAKDIGVSNTILAQLAWGLGWGLQINHEGKPIYAFHSGDMNDHRAFVAMDLENKTGIVFFVNSKNGLLLSEKIICPVVPIYPALEYISKKYGFAIRHEPDWKTREQERFEKIGNYLTFCKEHKIPKSSVLLLKNCGLFRKLEEGFLIEHRHDDPKIQREYDERFGLVLKN